MPLSPSFSSLGLGQRCPPTQVRGEEEGPALLGMVAPPQQLSFVKVGRGKAAKAESVSMTAPSSFISTWRVPGARTAQGQFPEERWGRWKGYDPSSVTVWDVLDDWDVGVKISPAEGFVLTQEPRACEHGAGPRIAPLGFLELYADGEHKVSQFWRGGEDEKKRGEIKKQVHFWKRVVYAVHMLVMGNPFQVGAEAQGPMSRDNAVKALEEMIPSGGTLSKLVNNMLPEKQMTPSKYEDGRIKELMEPSSSWGAQQ